MHPAATASATGANAASALACTLPLLATGMGAD
jgi:hypothetical protein